MNLPLFIARRYLFAKKSHNVINIISAISAAGICIGTAALILILSIYNGLDAIVRDSMGFVEPDILVKPSSGKTLRLESDTWERLAAVSGVTSVQPVIEEDVFVDYGGSQATARIKGIRDSYPEEIPLADNLTEGTFMLHKGSLYKSVTGAILSAHLGMSPRFVNGLDIYFPKTDKAPSLMDPMSSLNSIRVFPAGTISLNNQFDAQYIFIPIEAAMNLIGTEWNEYSQIEIRVISNSTKDISTSAYRRSVSAAKAQAAEILGDGIRLLDRQEQNATLYRMLRAEKVIVLMILLFVIIIVAFNIFGSLTMLVMDKRGDLETFKALGLSQHGARRIFIYEGWLISLSGLAAGVAIGIVAALVQQHFGIVKMPGNFTISAYPVILKFKDVLLSAACVGMIGYIIAVLPVRSLFRKLPQNSEENGD